MHQNKHKQYYSNKNQILFQDSSAYKYRIKNSILYYYSIVIISKALTHSSGLYLVYKLNAMFLV